MQQYSEGFFGILVPDVEDAAAAGENAEEALQETSKKLSTQLKRIPPRSRFRGPAPRMSPPRKRRKALAIVDDDGGEFLHVVSWTMIEGAVNFCLVEELPAGELERLMKKYSSHSKLVEGDKLVVYHKSIERSSCTGP